MTDPTKLHRLFAEQKHFNVENRYPVRGVVKSYDGSTVQVYIPAFDGGQSPFPVSYVGANFQPDDLVLVCKDEADTYWIVGMQAVPITQAKFTGGGSQNAGGGSSTGGGSGSLPKNASKYLNSSQMQFCQRFQADTGLEPAVICGWIHSEQPPSDSAAPNGKCNWMNIGSTDSGFYGGGNNAWDNPVSAADLSAKWMKGEVSLPGFGTASQGIQNIIKSAGKGIDAQIHAIQTSGWASSGYPNLPSVVGLFR